MEVRVAGITFGQVDYDQAADILYLHRGSPARSLTVETTVEGHHLGFDSKGRLVRITILNPRWLLEREGRITVTLPSSLAAEPVDLTDVLAAVS